MSLAERGHWGPYGSSSIGVALAGHYQARMSSEGLEVLETMLGVGAQMNRAHIVEELLWRASRLTPEMGYEIAVYLVDCVMRPYDEVGRESMPAVLIFPATAQPPPTYEVAGLKTESLDVNVVFHVSGDNHQDRRLQLALLEAAFFEEIDKDPERGGWAMDTFRSSGGQTDEGVPERDGRTDGTASMVTMLRIPFYPGLHTEKPMRHADAYVSTPAATTLLAPSIFARPAGVWSQGVLPRGFTVGANGDLAYTRERPATFRMTAVLSVFAAVAGQVSAQLNVAGSSLTRTRVDVDVGAGETVQIHIEALVDLNQSDAAYVELAHDSDTGLTVQRATFTVSTMALV